MSDALVSREEFGHTDTGPQREDAIEGGGRDGRDASISQGRLRTAGHTRSWKREGRSLPGAFRGSLALLTP